MSVGSWRTKERRSLAGVYSRGRDAETGRPLTRTRPAATILTTPQENNHATEPLPRPVGRPLPASAGPRAGGALPSPIAPGPAARETSAGQGAGLPRRQPARQ